MFVPNPSLYDILLIPFEWINEIIQTKKLKKDLKAIVKILQSGKNIHECRVYLVNKKRSRIYIDNVIAIALGVMSGMFDDSGKYIASFNFNKIDDAKIKCVFETNSDFNKFCQLSSLYKDRICNFKENTMSYTVKKILKEAVGTHTYCIKPKPFWYSLELIDMGDSWLSILNQIATEHNVNIAGIENLTSTIMDTIAKNISGYFHRRLLFELHENTSIYSTNVYFYILLYFYEYFSKRVPDKNNEKMVKYGDFISLENLFNCYYCSAYSTYVFGSKLNIILASNAGKVLDADTLLLQKIPKEIQSVEIMKDIINFETFSELPTENI